MTFESRLDSAERGETHARAEQLACLASLSRRCGLSLCDSELGPERRLASAPLSGRSVRDRVGAVSLKRVG